MVEVQSDDHDFICTLLGYANIENWSQFNTELPIESDVSKEYDDFETFYPSAGSVLPSERFYHKHTIEDEYCDG